MKILHVETSSMFLPVAASRNKISEKPDDLASRKDFTTFSGRKKLIKYVRKRKENQITLALYYLFLVSLTGE